LPWNQLPGERNLLSNNRPNNRLFYGWIVVIAFFVFTTLAYGTRYSFGVFFTPLQNEFSLTRAETSSIFSAYAILTIVFAILFGWIFDRYGLKRIIFIMGLFTGLSLLLTSQTVSTWQLYMTYSLLLAIGTGAGIPLLTATISKWFNKKRGIAIGIASSGNGLGILLGAPFATYLITNFNWRTAFIFMGIIAGLLIISASLWMKKDPAEIGLLPDGVNSASNGKAINENNNYSNESGLTLRQVLRTRSLWYFMAIWLLWGMSYHLILTHIVPHALDKGISAARAAEVLGLIGGLAIPGRIIIGFVSDRIGRKWTAIICAILEITAVLLLMWSSDLRVFYIFAVLYGFGNGGFSPSNFSLVGEVFGLHSIGIILGIIEAAWGLGSAIGPLTGGLIFDITRSYNIAFYIVLLAILGIALFVTLIPGREKRLRPGNKL